MTLVPHDNAAPFADHEDLYSTIDAIKLDGVLLQSYTAQYNGARPDDGPIPEWMANDYHLWYRDPRKVIHNMLVNPNLMDGIDYVPYHEFENDKRRYCDFMSGNWAWKQSVRFNFPMMLARANPFPIRTLSQRTLIHMDHSLSPSYLEAIRQLCPLRLANKSITLYTFQLGMFITTFDEPTNTLSF